MKQGKCSGEINNIGLKPRHSENILVEVVLHRLSRNFNPPTPLPGHLTIFCAQGVGNLTFAWVWWGKLNRNC